MALKSLVILILIFLVPAVQADSFSEAMSHCRSDDSQELAPGPNEDPDDFADRIKVSQSAKEANCEAANTALAAREQALSKLYNLMSALTVEEILKPVKKVEGFVDARLQALELKLKQLRAIPNSGSSENSARLREMDGQLTQEQKAKEQLDSSWDSLQDSSKEGKLADLIKLKSDPQLPVNARISIDAYLTKLPPYLLGKGKAPREKIAFLDSQLRLVTRAVQIKNLDYSAHVRNQVKLDLHKDLSEDLLAARAGAIRDSLLAQFGRATPSWASLIANPQGACALAREEMADQIRALKSAMATSGPSIQIALQKEIEPEIAERSLVMKSLPCDQTTDAQRLIKSLKRQESRLAVCNSKIAMIRKDAEGLKNDLHNWLAAAKDQRAISRLDGFQDFGESLWNVASNLIQKCSRGTL